MQRVVAKKDDGKEALEALKKLRSFLTVMEPELVYFLVNLFKRQGKAITYKELREAIMRGDIPASLFDEWQQDYSRFVTSKLLPRWIESMKVANADREARFPEWRFDPMGDGVQAWTERHSAELVTNVTNAQIEGIRAVVQRAAVLEDMTVDQLSRAIRPMVGLTKPQSIANLNYYNTLIGNGINPEKAQDLALRYAARQHRYRAYSIARTELATAYNQGAYQGIKQAQEAGYLGEMVKVWCTAEDERVCPTCGGLEGAIVGMDEDFSIANRGHKFTGRIPPAHPGCRCALIHKEISPPTR